MIFNTDHHTIPAVPYLTPSEPIPERLKIVQPAGGLSVGLVGLPILTINHVSK